MPRSRTTTTTAPTPAVSTLSADGRTDLPGPLEVRWPVNPLICFHGRNGTAVCSGVALRLHGRVEPQDTVIDLQPYTSQNKPGNCHLEIPIDCVPQVVQALKRLYAEHRAASCGNALQVGDPAANTGRRR